MRSRRSRSIEEDLRRFEEITRSYLDSRTQPAIDVFLRGIFGKRGQ